MIILLKNKELSSERSFIISEIDSTLTDGPRGDDNTTSADESNHIYHLSTVIGTFLNN